MGFDFTFLLTDTLLRYQLSNFFRFFWAVLSEPFSRKTAESVSTSIVQSRIFCKCYNHKNHLDNFFLNYTRYRV